MENTKLTISKDLYLKLIDDKFNYSFKSQNDYFTTVIINTYKYQNKIKKIETIKKVLLNSSNKLSQNGLSQKLIESQNDLYFDKQLTEIAVLLSSALNNTTSLASDEKKIVYVRDTAKTNGMLETIYEEALSLRAATLFETLLIDYINYPLYVREQIICIDNYTKLKEIKRTGLSCKITTEKKDYNFDIYDIVKGKEEYHYYVIGIVYDTKRELKCFKLSTISKIFKYTKPNNINEQEIKDIKARIEKGPEWIGGKFVENCLIKFDDKGLKRYNQLYKDRPKMHDTDDKYIKSFSCSEVQLFNYLRQFGCHAIPINNPKLKKGLKTHYTEAYKAYKE